MSTLKFLGTGPTDIVKGKGKNRRTNTSALLEYNNATVLINLTKDFDEQIKRAGIEPDDLDGIIISHAHRDANGGLHLLKEWLDDKGYDYEEKPIPIYLESQTLKQTKKDFKQRDHVEPVIVKPGKQFSIENAKVKPFRVKHSRKPKKYPMLGFRFGDKLTWCEDVAGVPDKSEKYFDNVDNVCLDSAMYFNKSIFNHFSVEDTLEFMKDKDVKTLYLVQAGRTYPGYDKAVKEINKYWKELDGKADVKLSYDGMTVRKLKEINEGWYLTPRHAKLIYAGEKDLIVKAKNFKNEINEEKYLIGGNKAYGTIILKNPKQITLDEFDKLRDRHKITENEYKKWSELYNGWCNKTLYAYEFEFAKLTHPRYAKIPRGIQTIVKDVKLLVTEENIKDIADYDPKDLGNAQLRDDLRISMAWYSSIKRGKDIHVGGDKLSLEDVVNMAKLIYDEIEHRKSQGKMKHCMPPSQPVLTNFGIKNIEKIDDEQSILSPTGKDYITKTFEHDYDGDIVNIKPLGLPKMEFTTKHPILVATVEPCMYNSQNPKPYGPQNCKPNCTIKNRCGRKPEYTIRWKFAKDLNYRDYLIIPKIQEEHLHRFDMSSFISSNFKFNEKHVWYIHNKKRKINRYINLNKEVAELLGIFVAEGHTSFREPSYYGIGFSIGRHEKEFRDRILFLFKDIFGIELSVRDNGKNSITLSTVSMPIARFFRKMCGSSSRNKKTPDIILYSPKEVCNSFIDGYIAGDGYTDKKGYTTAATTSKELAYQMIFIGAKCGMRVGVARRYQKPTTIRNHEVIGGEQWRLYFSTGKDDLSWWQDENYLAIPIKNLAKSRYSGKVYNFETGTHTYLAPFVVHNSFHPEKMKKYSKELYKKISGKSILDWEHVEKSLSSDMDPVRKEQIINKLEGSKSLDKTIPHIIDNLKIIDSFACLVGSVAENGTGNDIDILLRLSEENDYIRRAVSTRLSKILESHGIMKPVHVFCEAEGGHDRFVPLYDLVLVKRDNNELIDMREIDPSKIFKPVKTTAKTYYDKKKLAGALF